MQDGQGALIYDENYTRDPVRAVPSPSLADHGASDCETDVDPLLV